MEFEIIAVLLLLAASGFFSGCEAAILTINRMRLRYLLKKTKFSTQAKTLSRLKTNTLRTIMTILLANNIANISASFIVAHTTSTTFGDQYLGLSAGILTFFLIIFSEIIPKNYGTNHADSVALFSAGPIEILSTVLSPIVNSLEWINKMVPGVYPIPGQKIGMTEEELRSVLEVGVEERTITHDEKNLFERVLDFNDTYAKEIMTPKKSVRCLHASDSREEMVRQISKFGKSHYPVVDESGKVVGVLKVKRLLAAGPLAHVKDILDSPFFVSREMVASELFKKMQKSNMRMAIVLDPDGKMEGIVTIEDLLEEIVGEIGEGEVQQVQTHALAVKTIQLTGDARVHDIEKELSLTLPDSDRYAAVSGYLHYQLRKLPSRGDVVILGKCRLEVKEVDKDYRVTKVEASRLP